MQHFDLSILFAYVAGELSEGQAAKALGVDRIELRSLASEQIERGLLEYARITGKNQK